MDLSFESDYVWKTQTLEEYESFESSFQRIRLPKTIRVSFQAYSSANLETLIRNREILSVRYDDRVIGYVRLERDETVDRLLRSRLKGAALSDRAALKKATDALLRKGYGWDDVQAAVERLRAEESEED